MLKPGTYRSINDDNVFDCYEILMDVHETEKSYVFELRKPEARYAIVHVETLFKKSNKFVLKKGRPGHTIRVSNDHTFTLYPYQLGVPYYFEHYERRDDDGTHSIDA